MENVEFEFYRALTKKERSSDYLKRRGLIAMPYKPDWKACYKPYGNGGEKSGAGYYYYRTINE